MLAEEKRKLELEAARIRKTALETIHTAGSGHIGGSFSMADIMAVLYFKAMNIDPKDPDKADRDRLVLSKGHCSPVMYATLARRGFFPVEHLKTFRRIDSDLSGHVEIHVPGVDMSGGSLGQGLSVALGMAMFAKANKTGNYVYAIITTIIVIIMVYRHHENIGRLKAGNERKVHWMDRKKQVQN